MLWLNLFGVILIAFIVIWFWLLKPGAQKTNAQHIKIIVKNGIYSPSHIEINTNKPIVLEFLREDASACSEWVNFDRLNLHVKLPLNQSYEVPLGQLSPGVYPFSCQMKMYQGELTVIH